jgi:hypothetical protein
MDETLCDIKEMESYLDKLVQSELSYDKDFITREGWNVIETTAPEKTMQKIRNQIKDCDETEMLQSQIKEMYYETLNEYAPKDGLRYYPE